MQKSDFEAITEIIIREGCSNGVFLILKYDLCGWAFRLVTPSPRDKPQLPPNPSPPLSPLQIEVPSKFQTL